jgi:hypothetical protein
MIEKRFSPCQATAKLPEDLRLDLSKVQGLDMEPLHPSCTQISERKMIMAKYLISFPRAAMNVPDSER